MARTGSPQPQSTLGRILMCLVRLRLRHLLQPPISNPACARLLCHCHLFLFSETQQRQQVDPPPTINSRTSSSTGASSTFKRGDYLEDREFGVGNSTDAAQLRAKTLDSAQRRVEGSDASKGSGGVVAAIRDKYTRAVSGYFRRPSYHSKSSF